jgi:uncharacterized metal-binding protein
MRRGVSDGNFALATFDIRLPRATMVILARAVETMLRLAVRSRAFSNVARRTARETRRGLSIALCQLRCAEAMVIKLLETIGTAHS